jgi:hypothetical protein
MKIIASFILTGLVISHACAQVEHEWCVTLKVLDELGMPISGANAGIGYYTNSVGTSADGLTNTNGIFSASHASYGGDLGCIAEKDGYYTTRRSYKVPFTYDPIRWNPTITLVLKKIGKPIPMYAQQARIEIPELRKPIGFDLTEGDWVAPYGRGKESDFIFQAQRRFVNRQDFESSFTLTFHQPHDGVFPIKIPIDQGSELRLSAIAPTNGYLTELSQMLNDTPSKGWEKSEEKDQNYYFRVRTKIDDRGNIVSAHYGKVYGDFKIDAINSKTLLIFFQYYFNPTPNSRNVEFDPKANLFHQLSNRQAVNVP